jgi:hypothetical protein
LAENSKGLCLPRNLSAQAEQTLVSKQYQEAEGGRESVSGFGASRRAKRRIAFSRSKDTELTDSFELFVGGAILLVIVTTRFLFDDRAPRRGGKYGKCGLRWVPKSAPIQLSTGWRRVVIAIEIVAYVAGAAYILFALS